MSCLSLELMLPGNCYIKTAEPRVSRFRFVAFDGMPHANQSDNHWQVYK